MFCFFSQSIFIVFHKKKGRHNKYIKPPISKMSHKYPEISAQVSSHRAEVLDIFKVDGGDSMETSSLDHVASQAPVLGVRAELQDLVTIVIVIVTIIATWI